MKVNVSVVIDLPDGPVGTLDGLKDQIEESLKFDLDETYQSKVSVQVSDPMLLVHCHDRMCLVCHGRGDAHGADMCGPECNP